MKKKIKLVKAITTMIAALTSLLTLILGSIRHFG